MMFNMRTNAAQAPGSSVHDARAKMNERLAQAGLSDRISLVDTAAGLVASGNVDDADYAAWQDVKSLYAKARGALALTDNVRAFAVKAEDIGIGALESGPGKALILLSGERFEVGQTLPDGSKILCVEGDEAVLLREGRQTVVRNPGAPTNRGACSLKSGS